MRLGQLFVAGLFSLALCQASFAQDVSPQRASELAKQIYASKDVKKLASAAKAMRRIDPNAEDARVSGKVDCSQHPKPYGTEDTNFCAVELRASYGWYADPVLVITVKAFVPKAKLMAGTLEDGEISLRDFTATIPDPTGLE
jgi:hypothetical protein